MANTRFTILNDNKDQILISKSLRDQMTKQKQNIQKEETVSNAKNSSESISTSSDNSLANDNIQSSSDVNQSIYPEFLFLPPSQLHILYRLNNQTEQKPSTSSRYFLQFNEHEDKSLQYLILWHKNLEELERLNKDLLKKNKELMATEIKRIDDAVLKKHFDDTNTKNGIREEPCKETETKLLRCLELNGKKSLLCNHLIREFSQCVDKARLGMLKQK